MNTAQLSRTIDKCRDWFAKSPAQSVDAAWQTQDIIVGCTRILQQAGTDPHDWLHRDSKRFRLLRQIRSEYSTARGRKAVLALLALTQAAVDAAPWRTQWWSALPFVPNITTTSEARRAGLARAHAVLAEKRQARRKAIEDRLQKAVSPIDRPDIRAHCSDPKNTPENAGNNGGNDEPFRLSPYGISDRARRRRSRSLQEAAQ